MQHNMVSGTRGVKEATAAGRAAAWQTLALQIAAMQHSQPATGAAGELHARTPSMPSMSEELGNMNRKPARGCCAYLHARRVCRLAKAYCGPVGSRVAGGSRSQMPPQAHTAHPWPEQRSQHAHRLHLLAPCNGSSGTGAPSQVLTGSQTA